MKLLKIKVKDLQPNPYRNFKEYPLRSEKLDQLESSMSDTGFWGNIVCRAKGGKYQIAYGHHRLEVLNRRLKIDVVPVIVEDLSNEMMLKMMSRENHEAYGTDAWVEMEDIKQTIDAYDRGEIELPEIDEHARNVEIFDGPTSARQFTKLQIARFLGRTKDATHGNYGFEKAWKALELIEAGILDTKRFERLSREEMAVVSGRAEAALNIFEKEAKAAEKKASKAENKQKRERLIAEAKKLRTKGKEEARRVATKVEKMVRNGEGIRAARKTPITTIAKQEHLVDVDGLAKIIAKRLQGILSRKSDLIEQLNLLRKLKREAKQESLQMVCNELNGLVKRVETYSRSLDNV